MPKVIKKRPVKKKPVQESEVKSAALQALDVIKERQKQIIIGVSVILGIVLLFISISLYSTSQYKRSRALEIEAAKYYYGENIETAMTEEDRMNKAMDLFQQSVDIKTTPTALYYLGNTYLKTGDYDNAIKVYTGFASKYSSDSHILPLVYQKMASAYFKLNQNDKALDTLQKLAAVDNGIFRDTALMLEARYYESSDQKQKALDTYRKIVVEFPASPWSIDANAKIAAAEEEESKESDESSDESKEENNQ